jgi:hypothetical protein
VAPITTTINEPVGSVYTSLAVYESTRETYSSSIPFTASARYFNNVPAPGPTGLVHSDGTLIGADLFIADAVFNKTFKYAYPTGGIAVKYIGHQLDGPIGVAVTPAAKY